MKKAISSEDYLHLIGWLTQARLDLNWSMRDLAEKLDVVHSFVQRVETLERRLDVYEYVVYCRTLGLNPSAGLRFFVNPPQDKK
jgi:transcriptional regulator with XRE-family HTH domain